MPNFYTDVIQHSPQFHTTNRVNDLELLEPTFRAAITALLADATAGGTPFEVIETYRSCERQTALFNQGATKLRTVGVHHYGLACDLAKVVNGSASFAGDFSALGKLASQHGLIWGGDWGSPGVRHTFYDYDHIQGVAVADQVRLFAGTWYPQ